MKLYLAGPDVFLPDAEVFGQRKRELCARYGFIGLFPLDNEIAPDPGVRLSKAIFEANLAMIDAADAVVANLTPFRGVSADVGTVFEIGYGYATKKKVFAYSNVRTAYVERIRRLVGGEMRSGNDGRLYATDGMAAENFDLFDNLMIAEAVRASGCDIVYPATDPVDPWRDLTAFDECLRRIQAQTMQAPLHVQTAG